jgi:hypothetical protein
VSVTHEEYLVAFDSYRDALEAAGFSLTDVHLDERGLLTWAVGSGDSVLERDAMEAIHREHFHDVELAYVKQVLCS